MQVKFANLTHTRAHAYAGQFCKIALQAAYGRNRGETGGRQSCFVKKRR